MKKVLALLLAMLLSVSVLSGCGSNEQTTDEQTTEQTQETEKTPTSSADNMVSNDCKGDVLTWNLGGDSEALDPAWSVSSGSMSVVNNTFEGLMRNTGSGAQPAMAADMPQEKVNEDGTVTLTYTLRDASWSDGEPVKAQDFEFAWKRCANPENNASNAYLMSVLTGYDDIAQGLAEIDTLGVKAVDDKTLEVTLNQQTPYFNELLCLPAFMPLREDLVSSDSSWSKDPTRAVSNGPFTLVGYTEGVEFVLEKNKEYWNKDSISLDYIVAKMLDDNFAPVGMAFGDIVMTDGTISQPEDQTDTAGNTVEVPELASTIEASTAASNRVVSLVVNANTGNELLKNADVRAALSKALDRTAAAQAAGGEALTSVSGAQEILSAAADDSGKSVIEAALADAGDSSTIEIVYLDNEQTAAALQTVKSAWEALGLTVNLTAQDAETFKLSRNSLQYSDVLCSVWEADVNDQQLYLQPYLSSNLQSGCGYTNPDFDQLMLDAMQATGEERTTKLNEAEKVLVDDAYVMPLYRNVITTTTDTAKVSGWTVDGNGMYWFGSTTLA